MKLNSDMAPSMEEHETIRNVKIVYAELPPFVEISYHNSVEVLGGFMPALFEAIARWMNLNVTWIREPEDKYGTWENNMWTGMCGMLSREEVDFILNPLLPSAEYAEVAYYTNPVLFEAFTFLSGKKKQDGGLFLYFSVLEPSVWLSMAVALIVISLTSALLYKMIFDEKWNSWIGSLGQYLWVYVAYTLRQNPHDKWMLREDKSLLSFLVVLLITVWVVGVSFLVMTVFQSLLVSKLTIIKSLPIIDSLEDFVSKTKVKGAVPIEIELQEVLKDSGIPLYEKAWEKMEKTLLTSDQVFSDRSFQKVEMGEICIPHGHVFLKGVLDDYFKLHGRCDFHLSNNYFFPFPLLMGLRKSLPNTFQRKFNSGLSQLIASDISGKWLKTIYEGSRLCTTYSENALEPLHLKNIFGVLLIWGVGMTLSICCFIVEILHFKPNGPNYHSKSNRNINRLT